MRLAADLAVQPEPDAAERVKAATPIRSIEAAIHLADGDKSFASRQYEAAAKAYERVLLAEPKNLAVAIRRTRAWSEVKDYPRTIEAGEQALAAGLSLKSILPNDRSSVLPPPRSLPWQAPTDVQDRSTRRWRSAGRSSTNVRPRGW